MSNEKHLDDLEQLVLDHMDLLYTVALKLTHNATDAQRLTQTTIVKALRFGNKLEVRAHVKAWLLSTMRNTFIDGYCRKAEPLTPGGLRRNEPAVSIRPDPQTSCGRKATRPNELLDLLDAKVKRGLGSLPEHLRDTLIMVEVEGMRCKEVSRATDCSFGTVMSRLYRGRKLLRARLDNYAKERDSIRA